MSLSRELEFEKHKETKLAIEYANVRVHKIYQPIKHMANNEALRTWRPKLTPSVPSCEIAPLALPLNEAPRWRL